MIAQVQFSEHQDSAKARPTDETERWFSHRLDAAMNAKGLNERLSRALFLFRYLMRIPKGARIHEQFLASQNHS